MARYRQRTSQRGLSLDDIISPGSSTFSLDESSNAYQNENQSEDIDVKLGSDGVEEPYSSGNGPLGTRFDDKIDPIKTHKVSLYSGWAVAANKLYEFNDAIVTNIDQLGDLWQFDLLDGDTWVRVASSEYPSDSGLSYSAADILAKVKKEVDSLYEDGLQEVDVRQAVLNRYGRAVYDAIFEKIAQD